MLVAELSTLRLEPGSRLAELDWGPLVSGETARRIVASPLRGGPFSRLHHAGAGGLQRRDPARGAPLTLGTGSYPESP